MSVAKLNVEIKGGEIVAWFSGASDAIFMTEAEARECAARLVHAADFLYVDNGFRALERKA